MDASCEIQGNIHVFRLINNMCPGFWVHITNAGFSLYKKPPIPRVGIRGSSTQMVLSKMLAGIGLRRWSPRNKAPATYDGAHSIALLHSEQSQGQVLLSLR